MTNILIYDEAGIWPKEDNIKLRKQLKEILDRNFERNQVGNPIVIKRDDVIGRVDE